MLDEQTIGAALRLEATRAALPGDLLSKVKREALRPPSPKWNAPWARKFVRLAAGLAVALLLAGFANQFASFVVPARPVNPGEVVPSRPRKTVSIQEVSSVAGFPVKLPTYLPEGISLFESRVVGDAQEAGSQFGVIEVFYIQRGKKGEIKRGISFQAWRGDRAAPFPPGDRHGEVMDTEPWHKTFGTRQVNIGGLEVTALTYLLSGINLHRVYWHDQGVNYAISADVTEPLEELMNVARSVR